MAAAARTVGPPQGITFMIPAASATMVASTQRFIFSFWNRGIQAGMAIRKVVAPEPSKWQMQPMRKVPIQTLTGSSPVNFRMRLMIGSKTPASEQVLKTGWQR